MSLIETQYELTAPTMSMRSTENAYFTEIRSDNNSIINDTQFRLQLKNLNDYINLSKSYLEVKFKIKKGAAVALDAADITTLQNGLTSLFNRLVLRVNGSIVEDVNESNMVGLIKSILHYSDDYLKSVGSNGFYYKETGVGAIDGLAEYTNPSGEIVARNANYNDGFVQRFALSKESQLVCCALPLHELFGFCSVDRIMKNCDISLEFTKASADASVCGAVANAYVEMEKISWWCSIQKPSVQVELALNAQLAAGVVSEWKFPFATGYESSSFPALTSGRQNFRVSTTSERPLYAFAMLHGATQSTQLNNQVSNAGISEISVRMNGIQNPQQPYQPVKNAAGEYSDFARIYSDVLDYMQKDSDYSNGGTLLRNDWVNMTSLFAFDLRASPPSLTNSPIELTVDFTLDGTSNDVDTKLFICVVTERSVVLSWRGSSAVVSIA